LAGDEKKSIKANVPLSGDGDQADGFDLNSMPNLEEAQLEAGRPLPKKVELDIDDIFAEEGEKPEETPESEPEKETAAVLETEPPPPKYAFYKVVLLGGAGVLVLAGLIALVMWLVPEIQPAGVRQLIKAPVSMELQPFIINYPDEQRDTIIKLRVSLSFSNAQAREEFSGRLLTMRDLLFRYMQGQGPIDPKSQEAKDKLRENLIRLISGTLKKGKIKDLQILEFLLV